MFEFFIALFGGLFYGGKYLSERQDKRSLEKRNMDFQTIYRQISRPWSYEYMPPETYKEFIAMLESIEDDLKFIFGEDWKNSYFGYSELNNIRGLFKLSNKTNIQDGFENIPMLAYEVWLSSKGFIPPTRNYYNYKIPLYGYDRPATEKEKRIIERACQTIEKNMQKAHPGLPLRLRLSNPDVKANRWVWEHWVKQYDGTTSGAPW